MDGVLLGFGTAFIVISLPMIVRPDSLVRYSRRHRDSRLAELKKGAKETYFEERRELEAYPPRFNLTNTMLRKIGIAQCLLGMLVILWGVFQ